jgi:nucleoside-diphosphate-sugar epimerase
MPRILIAGCGYIGTATADLFHSAGWEVQGWTRSGESAAKLAEKPYPVIAVDIANAREIGGRPENFDAVIHCASTRGGDADRYRETYLEGARDLRDRFLGSTILFASSTSVYAQRDGSWVTEKSETEPAAETSRILLEAEKIILRPGGIVARATP